MHSYLSQGKIPSTASQNEVTFYIAPTGVWTCDLPHASASLKSTLIEKKELVANYTNVGHLKSHLLNCHC
jgi:hypothetical protein